MEEFFNSNSSDIKYIAIVIVIVVILVIMTRLLSNRLLKRRKISWAYSLTSSFTIVRRVLTILWIILGLIAISFVFADESQYVLLSENFKLVLYLGILSVITIIAASAINIWFGQVIDKRILEGEDPTNFKFLRYVAVVGIYITGILFGLMAIPSLNDIAQTALGGAGVLAIVVGLSSQEALSNIIGGIFIITFKPFRVGDIIAVDNTETGVVTDITLRHTIIRTWKNRRIIIPNSIVNKSRVENFSAGEEKCCEYIVIGISYDSDVDLAKKILREEVESHPLMIDNRTDEQKEKGAPIGRVAVVELADSSINLRAWAWAETYGESIAIKRDVFETVKKRFDKEGIEIPFPYRTLVIKSGEKNPKS